VCTATVPDRVVLPEREVEARPRNRLKPFGLTRGARYTYRPSFGNLSSTDCGLPFLVGGSQGPDREREGILCAVRAS
jgi:hypothetical protein